MIGDDQKKMIETLDWLHTIQIEDQVTKGRYDWRPYFDYFLPGDISNLSVLDVGAGDGYFSFEFEKLGAVVTALDLPSQDERDNNQFGVSNKNISQAHPDSFTPAFKLSKELFDSNVNHWAMNLYELINSERKFDVVFCNDVLLHLTDPFRALCAFRKVCTKYLVIGTPVFEPLGFRQKLAARFTGWYPMARFLGAGQYNAFWFPNQKCLADWVTGAGFKVTSNKTFKPKLEHAEFDGLRGVVVAEPN